MRRATDILRITSLRFYRTTAHAPEPALRVHDDIEPVIVTRWEDLPEHLQTSPHAAVYAERLSSRHVAFLLLENGTVMHASWIARHALGIDELGCRVALADDAVCVYDVVTASAWRGRGLYPAVLRYMRRHAGRLFGARVVWIYCDGSNAASIRGIEKAEYTYCGTRYAVVIGGRCYLRLGYIKGGLPCA